MAEPSSPEIRPDPPAAVNTLPAPEPPPPRLDEFTRLRERLADLQALSRAQEEQWSQLANRLAALEQAPAADSGLGERLATLSAEVQALREALPAAPGQAQAPDAPAALELVAANDAEVEATALERRINELAADLEGRLDAMQAQVAAARTYSRRQAATQRAWDDARRRRWVLGLGVPVAAMLAVVALLAAGAWWQVERQTRALDRKVGALDAQARSERRAERAQLDERLAALRKELIRLERDDAASLERQQQILEARVSNALIGDVLTRLRRLERTGGETALASAPTPVPASARTPAGSPTAPIDTATGAQAAVVPDAPAEGGGTKGADPATAAWMIQLIGYRDAARLRAFAAEQGLTKAGGSGPRAWMSSGRWRGAPWYTLYWGGFGDRGEAAQAMAALPPTLAALEPILRRVPTELSLEPVAGPAAEPVVR
jgi:septal ring-binding cell division protein DamX